MATPTTEQMADLAGRTAADVADLVQAELALARTELRQELRRVVKATVSVVVAAVLALLAVLVVVFAACWALASVLPTGGAFGVVGGALLVVSLPLLLYAVAKLRRVDPPMPETRKTLDEVASWTHALRR